MVELEVAPARLDSRIRSRRSVGSDSAAGGTASGQIGYGDRSGRRRLRNQPGNTLTLQVVRENNVECLRLVGGHRGGDWRQRYTDAGVQRELNTPGFLGVLL